MSIFPSRGRAYSPLWSRSRELFSCLSDCDQSDVVILWLRTDEVSQVVDQSCDNSRGPTRCARAHRLNHPFDAEFVSFRVNRFRHSIGIENQAIVPLERDGDVVCEPIKDISAVNSENHARRL